MCEKHLRIYPDLSDVEETSGPDRSFEQKEEEVLDNISIKL